MTTRAWLAALLALVLAAQGNAAPEQDANPWGYDAADPAAPPVTAATLAAHERFWPYQVELTEPWQPPGRETPLPARTLAVLIRIDPAGAARIDFGRDGVFEVPVAKTDLVKRANDVRTGRLSKLAPNLVLAVGPRLMDSAAEKLDYHDRKTIAKARGFLAVFADPTAEGFRALAASLAPLRGRHGVMTMFFPQGQHPELGVRTVLHGVGWQVPFVLDQFSEGYTRSLRADAERFPAVMLLTPDGRVLLDRVWTE